MAAHICDRCSKTQASRQSLWNHRQHCKDSKDELHTTLGNGLVIKSRSRTPSVHKEKIVSDIINNVGKMQEPKSDTGKEDIVEKFLNKVAQITNKQFCNSRLKMYKIYLPSKRGRGLFILITEFEV